MDNCPYHMTKWDPQPIVSGSWARVHPDPLNYNKNIVKKIIDVNFFNICNVNFLENIL